MFVGRCFDNTINFNYNHKIKNGVDEKSSVVKDFFNETFKSGKEEVQFEKEEKPDVLKDTGIKTTECFHKEICSKVKPKNVQVEDEVFFENVNYSIKVIVDLVVEGDILVDNKYTAKTWAQGKEDGELDPVIYTLWYENKYKINKSSFRFDIGISTMTPKTDQRFVSITPENKKGFLKYLAYIHDSIMYDTNRGIFLPRTDHFLCSKKLCGYWEKCSNFWGHRIKD
jgi:hypothetical protein